MPRELNDKQVSIRNKKNINLYNLYNIVYYIYIIFIIFGSTVEQLHNVVLNQHQSSRLMFLHPIHPVPLWFSNPWRIETSVSGSPFYNLIKNPFKKKRFMGFYFYHPYILDWVPHVFLQVLKFSEHVSLWIIWSLMIDIQPCLDMSPISTCVGSV